MLDMAIIQKNKRGIKPEIQTNPHPVLNESKLEVSLDERIDRFDIKKQKFDVKKRTKTKNHKVVVIKNNLK